LRAFYASSLAHQITNSAVHRFYATGGSWQIQFGIFPIGSEMVDPSEKLSNNHAHDAQSGCFANKMPQFFEHGLQPRPIRQLQSLPDMLVKRFAQGSVLQSTIASASAALQSADEMKMAELNDQPWLVPSLIIPEISSETEAWMRLCMRAGIVVNA
jgi:hypothetical protein